MCLRGSRLRGAEKQTARGYQKLADFPDGARRKAGTSRPVGRKYGGKHKGKFYLFCF